MHEVVVSMDAGTARRNSSGKSSRNLLPTCRTVQMATTIVKNEKRFWKLTSDLFLYILLTTLLTLALNKRIPTSPYICQKSIVDTFVRVRYKGNISFTEVNTVGP